MSRRASPLAGRRIFVVGSRRSGTQLVQRMLSTSPHVHSVFQETHLFSHGLQPLYDRIQHRVVDAAETGRFCADESTCDDAVRDMCDALFASHLQPPHSYLVDRTPLHVFHLDLIQRIYPDAAIIHVIRDGRDVARSLVNQPWGPRDIGTAAAAWRDSVLVGHSSSHARMTEIRYESLLDDSEAIKELFRFLGVPSPSSGEIETEMSRVTNVDPTSPHPAAAKWKASYSSVELAEFDAAAGDLLRELGYEQAEVARPDEAEAPAFSDWNVHAIHGDEVGSLGSVQDVFEQLLGTVQRRDATGLEALLSSSAAIAIHDTVGIRKVNGLPEFMQVLRDDPLFDGGQVRGDVVQSFPVFSGVLTFRAADGSSGSAVVFAAIKGRLVHDLRMYRF